MTDADPDPDPLRDLFRTEVREQSATLARGLLDLDRAPAAPGPLDELAQAARTVRGAARIVGLSDAARLAEALEGWFAAARAGRALTTADLETCQRAGTALAALSDTDLAAWTEQRAGEVAALIEALAARGLADDGAEAPAAPSRERQEEETPPPAFVPLTDPSMLELFREEVRAHAATLNAGLLELEREPANPQRVEPLMRAAHSLKGAARIVGLDPAVSLAHDLEDAFVAAQAGRIRIDAAAVDVFLRGADLLAALGDGDLAQWVATRHADVAALRAAVSAIARGEAAPPSGPPSTGFAAASPSLPPSPGFAGEGRGVRENPASRAGELINGVAGSPSPPSPLPQSRERGEVKTGLPQRAETVDRLGAPATVSAIAEPAEERKDSHPTDAVVRVTAQSLNRLMSLAGESLVQARWLQPFASSLLQLKRHQDRLTTHLDAMAQEVSAGRPADALAGPVADARQQAAHCRQVLAEQIGAFEDHAGAAEDLNTRLYREVIVSRMRPFADGAGGFPRLVRDTARRLGKQARLDVVGRDTEVDRDILEKLEAPLTHLLRNAVDHGLETTEARVAAGKAVEGVVTLEARHRAGMLVVTVADDGAGIDVERIRRKVVERRHSTAEMATRLTDAELLEFLFLPGFSTAGAVTEVSGRGVGLDVVRDTVRKVGGSVHVTTQPGCGTTFHLLLPITLSVLRAVLADIAGEPYAFPHNRIDRLLRVPRTEVRSVEHRQFVTVDGRPVGLVLAAQLLDLPADPPTGDDLPILLLSDATGAYGLIVEAFRGEQDLVVRPLDPRLGKVPNVSAAALLDDGGPVLIADVEDLIRSMDQFIQSGTLRRTDRAAAGPVAKKRVLVVDDSITVREVQRQILRTHGYDVEVAVDGQDGWNKVRSAPFDLVISDVDMPRLTGLEFVRRVREDYDLRDLPVVIVSYKDRDEDRLRGLEAGANHYLTKSSFHDHTFLDAVAALIGRPEG